jgi:hypothetical protein
MLWVYLIENVTLAACAAACFCFADGPWKFLGLCFFLVMNHFVKKNKKKPTP